MDETLWIGFVGHCDFESINAMREFENEVLALLPRHGAEVAVRASRAEGQGETLPAELQILRFPSRAAFEAFLVDPDRLKIQERYGEVFTRKAAVEIAPPFISKSGETYAQ